MVNILRRAENSDNNFGSKIFGSREGKCTVLLLTEQSDSLVENKTFPSTKLKTGTSYMI